MLPKQQRPILNDISYEVNGNCSQPLTVSQQLQNMFRELITNVNNKPNKSN